MPLSICHQFASVQGVPPRRVAPRPSAGPAVRAPRRERVLFAVAFVFVVGAEALLGVQIASALNAAGVTGGTPIAGLGRFVSSLRGNLIWIAVTAVGIAVIGIGLLFLFGHSRAQDYAIKALLGAAIIASGTGIVA